MNRWLLCSIDCVCCSCRWESVGSPHKLAWFWLQVLEKWTEEQVQYCMKTKELLFHVIWLTQNFTHPKQIIFTVFYSLKHHQCDVLSYICFHSWFQVSRSVRRELEFMLLLEELGSEGIPEGTLKVSIFIFLIREKKGYYCMIACLQSKL